MFRAMGGRLVGVLWLTAALAACGAGTPEASGPTTSTTTTTASPSGSSTSTPTTAAVTTTAPVPRSVDVRVYLMRVDKLGVADRRVGATPAVATAAVQQLLAGPTVGERAAGLSTAVPPATRLLGLSISRGTATVDLSGAFSSGGGSLSMTARLAQVTYTLTQFPSVANVAFRLDGRPVTVFGGEGIVLSHPAARSDFESVTPAILVEGPTPGDVAVSPLRVWGTANVFEATFRAQLIDASGRVVFDHQVRAASGTGTRGAFDVTVPFTGAAGGPGTLKTFDLSARDGSVQDLVAIPVAIR